MPRNPGALPGLTGLETCGPATSPAYPLPGMLLLQVPSHSWGYVAISQALLYDRFH